MTKKELRTYVLEHRENEETLSAYLDREKLIMTTTTEYKHILLNDQKVPIIAGTTLKVVELIMAQTAYGWSPEELHFQHPYLTMSQIYAALAYYWEHKAELDADIQQRETYAQEMQQKAKETPFVSRLKSQGIL